MPCIGSQIPQSLNPGPRGLKSIPNACAYILKILMWWRNVRKRIAVWLCPFGRFFLSVWQVHMPIGNLKNILKISKSGKNLIISYWLLFRRKKWYTIYVTFYHLYIGILFCDSFRLVFFAFLGMRYLRRIGRNQKKMWASMAWECAIWVLDPVVWKIGWVCCVCVPKIPKEREMVKKGL